MRTEPRARSKSTLATVMVSLAVSIFGSAYGQQPRSNNQVLDLVTDAPVERGAEEVGWKWRGRAGFEE